MKIDNEIIMYSYIMASCITKAVELVRENILSVPGLTFGDRDHDIVKDFALALYRTVTQPETRREEIENLLVDFLKSGTKEDAPFGGSGSPPFAYPAERIARAHCKHEALQALTEYYTGYMNKRGVDMARALLDKFCTHRLPLQGETVKPGAPLLTLGILCPNCGAVIHPDRIRVGSLVKIEDEGKI